MRLKNIHLDHSGLEMFVGSIDIAILEVLWEAQRAMSIRAIHNRLSDRWHYNTIATIIYRMAKSGLIERRNDIHPLYAPIEDDENAFIDRCILYTTERLRNEYPDTFHEVISGYSKVIK